MSSSQNPNTTNIDTSKATLTWDVVTGSWGYRIRYRENSSNIWIFDTTNTNSINLVGLDVTTTYK